MPHLYGGSALEHLPTFLANSPLHNATLSNATLLIYGENDVSLPSIERMFLTLQTAGVDAELITFWGENHNLVGP